MTFDFWSVIGSSPMRDASDVHVALSEVGARLQSLDLADLVAFQEQLAIQLERLGRDDLAALPIEARGGAIYWQTEDHFLYARCACLLAGQEAVRRVVGEPEWFAAFVVPNLQSSEKLMYLADREYELQAGEAMKVVQMPD
ncbi:DUF4240 domain-containing protein [Actinokineospora globicatena]|uniref:DUF4240 domain-containing protein n=1 Tax=Actinokineospora globicatena TaxID=103729 RepID=UPI0020A2E144|nr:DUF4240 domain-containing protein [Actinokineospora globicatena]GLW81038.1 hypothetical protein Aglo01_55190 [Actinokineospora globicatena]GLW88231.1 hypothetical protein Aglo02_58700 [Actinokineospora globicatena]